MKKLLTIVLTIIMIIGLGSVAYATDFGITLNQIGDSQNTLVYTTFPATYTVTGSVMFPTLENGEVDNSSIQIKLYVSTDPNAYTDPRKYAGEAIVQDTIQRNSGDPNPYPFRLDWAIDGPGTYYVIVTAKKANDIVEDNQEVIVTQQITATYPAAPAVAAHLLKAAGVDARYGSGKTGGNYISDVADAMGPTTLFMDVETGELVQKSDVINYRIAVAHFLNTKLAANGNTSTVTP